ncbi:alkaline phosphatase PafA [Salegentibacter chungangensis]|uniref:Alkaline phosphatase PafA n=1 Tax=Salegentibacter chungangensis TaxID=1335724 RepID=A0ABW3NVW6_9FLAO
MKRFTILLLFGLLALKATAQNYEKKNPKLVVGIVVDQMRYDYLTRFWSRFGEGGFKRLINDGFNFKNHHFNYVPTYTGPGHASVHTGTSPVNHGIIGNGWYSKFEKQEVYCVGDSGVRPIGTKDDAGKMSPHRMKSNTVADQNRLHTQMRGKTIGVAIKDRGSILPAGHTANAAYWFQGEDVGRWISSSYYVETLPKWVKEFNNSGKIESYLKTWDSYYDIETYAESGVDKNEFERGFARKQDASFPYDLSRLQEDNGGYNLIKETVFGNDLTTDFAKAAIEGESLGTDKDTDFLTLSFSSTDYIGHNFGVNSKEVEDAYIRLDKNIEDLLGYLDNTVGEGNYTIYLTADHGAVDVPNYLKSVGIPSGYFDDDKFIEDLEAFAEEEFGINGLIENVSNTQVFFNYKKMEEEDIRAEDMEEVLAHFILQQKQIDKVFTRTQMLSGSYTKGVAAGIQNGFNQRRSGDIVFVLDPNTIIYPRTGSTHGSAYSYDTHVPLIFYGSGVKKGTTTKRSEVVDIAPTVSAILGISFPNTATGEPLYIMLDE